MDYYYNNINITGKPYQWQVYFKTDTKKKNNFEFKFFKNIFFIQI